MTAEMMPMPVAELDGTAVLLCTGDGWQCRLPYLWLRDNCSCNECRIEQTSEKRFMLSSVPRDLAPRQVEMIGEVLHIAWPDDHRTQYDVSYLCSLGSDERTSAREWPKGFVPSRVAFDEFLGNDAVALSALDEFVELGAILLTGAPTAPATLERLVPRLGPIREVLFARIHDVQVDLHGYNVAHTSLPLPPHNDFASYSWPPSVQALHMLVNETTGGQSIIVDGWAVLERLRDDDEALFDMLCRTPVPFREFDDDNETYAVEPIVRLDVEGNISGFRFSNQLMQAIDPGLPDADRFYAAYHELCCRVTNPEAHSTFRLEGGQVLIVAGHRVLHGREAFDVGGRRHLQDAYFEFDNVRNYRKVLRRQGVANG